MALRTTAASCGFILQVILYSSVSTGHATGADAPPASEKRAAAPAAKPAADKPLFRHASYPAAWTAAQESNRPILVYVTMQRCPHCVKMIKQTYERPEVGKLVTDSFETLCVDRRSHGALVEKLDVRWYPTTVLVGSNNRVLDVIEGYVDAKTFRRRLQLGIASAAQTTQTR